MNQTHASVATYHVSRMYLKRSWESFANPPEIFALTTHYPLVASRFGAAWVKEKKIPLFKVSASWLDICSLSWSKIKAC